MLSMGDDRAFRADLMVVKGAEWLSFELAQVRFEEKRDSRS